MKKIRRRSMIIYALSLCFFIGIGVFLTNLSKDARTWALSPVNGHLSGNTLSHAGAIFDRNGTALAQSVDGKRIYHQDGNTRRSVLHTIGDGSLNIVTAVQNQYKAELFGYNLITGLSVPEYINTAKDITLTIDSDLCKMASEKLGNHKGAVVLYNYKTGEILCMASKPTYDPYNIPDLSKDLDQNYEGAYLNRVLSSSYTPGSVFKVITSAAGLENIPDLLTRTFTCKGKINVQGEEITCMEHHGNINFKDGMAKSCNIVFAEIAMQLGETAMTEQAEKMGFNESYQLGSRIPVKQSTYNVWAAREIDLGWSGIGQQNDLVNPLHLLRIMGAIANGGVPIEPYLIRTVSSKIGLGDTNTHQTIGTRMMSESTASTLKDIMRYTVQKQYGDSMFNGLSVCAKTGTAETGQGKLPHGWMAGFSVDTNCPLAFVVVVENSGFGYRQAGPIASSIMNAASGKLRG